MLLCWLRSYRAGKEEAHPGALALAATLCCVCWRLVWRRLCMSPQPSAARPPGAACCRPPLVARPADARPLQPPQQGCAALPAVPLQHDAVRGAGDAIPRAHRVSGCAFVAGGLASWLQVWHGAVFVHSKERPPPFEQRQGAVAKGMGLPPQLSPLRRVKKRTRCRTSTPPPQAQPAGCHLERIQRPHSRCLIIWCRRRRNCCAQVPLHARAAL